MKMSGTKVDLNNPVSRNGLKAVEMKQVNRSLWHQSALVWSLKFIVLGIIATFLCKISRISRVKEGNEGRNVW